MKRRAERDAAANDELAVRRRQLEEQVHCLLCLDEPVTHLLRIHHAYSMLHRDKHLPRLPSRCPIEAGKLSLEKELLKQFFSRKVPGGMFHHVAPSFRVVDSAATHTHTLSHTHTLRRKWIQHLLFGNQETEVKYMSLYAGWLARDFCL